MNTKMKIEIWSDIMCPFCYIGKRNFEAALAQFPGKDQVSIEWKSFQLDPAIPETPENASNVYHYLADRKGMSYEQSKRMHEDVTRYAESAGLDYRFEKTQVTNSLKGHRLIQLAKTRDLGDEAEERLFKAYFTEGVNLSDERELLRIGREIGLSEAEVKEALTDSHYAEKVLAESAEAQQLGITGVPFFVLNRKYGISGAQQPAEMLNSLAAAFADWKGSQLPADPDISEGPGCTTEGTCD